ncbi:MAG: hypothetical protein AAF638_13685 [Pseudomonadota bacterium]
MSDQLATNLGADAVSSSLRRMGGTSHLFVWGAFSGATVTVEVRSITGGTETDYVPLWDFEGLTEPGYVQLDTTDVHLQLRTTGGDGSTAVNAKCV